jgi:hypothetical protein
MVFEINKRTIEETHRCDKDFACLNIKEHVCCTVEKCVNKNILFMECGDENHCRNKLSFAGGFVCCCPVRLELHNKNLK